MSDSTIPDIDFDDRMAWVWTTLKNLIVGKIYYIGFAVKRDNPLDKVCGESVNANVDKPRFYHYTN